MTGSGKTFTMIGGEKMMNDDDEMVDGETDDHHNNMVDGERDGRGICYRVIDQLFTMKNNNNNHQNERNGIGEIKFIEKIIYFLSHLSLSLPSEVTFSLFHSKSLLFCHFVEHHF